MWWWIYKADFGNGGGWQPIGVAPGFLSPAMLDGFDRATEAAWSPFLPCAPGFPRLLRSPGPGAPPSVIPWLFGYC